ncbi:sel1 repeat family protein [Enterovibrio sp. ZSDZ35]|uniref:Sel1 repeat family protein n=1 Tax=Enterovibrio qingdaonensis TaxID=2899818 RepID=A0ABT5QHU4_9GAMM|nr:sel1 repeat family protein [Enterovibrio sp. ZSDZ35]MDD1780243.1 sel1 repeat family protein [Enterovibrio sp. ZSDZ35]
MKWLLPVVLFSAVGCTEDVKNEYTQCPTLQNYSDAFLNSDFFLGWQQLEKGKHPRQYCEHALPYFEAGVKNETVFELSTLYLDFCSNELTPSRLDESSIYTNQRMPTGVDYDEFKWVLDLALCHSPVEQYALGSMLYNGFITDKDTEKGIYFLTLSAKQGHFQAQRLLADALDAIGESEIAMHWREKATKDNVRASDLTD